MSALTGGPADIDGIADIAAANHVAAPLIVRIWIEQIVSDTLQNIFKALTAHG